MATRREDEWFDPAAYDIRRRYTPAPVAATGFRPFGMTATPQMRGALAEQFPTGFQGSQPRRPAPAQAIPNAPRTDDVFDLRALAIGDGSPSAGAPVRAAITERDSRGGVSTIPGPSLQDRLASMDRAAELRRGNQQLRDELQFNRGEVLSRQMSPDEVMRNMLGSRSRSDRALATRFFGDREAGERTARGQQAVLDLDREQFAAQAPGRAAQTSLLGAQEAVARAGLIPPPLSAVPGFNPEVVQALAAMSDQPGLTSYVNQYSNALDVLNQARAAFPDATLEELMQDEEIGPDFRSAYAMVYGAPRFADGGLVPSMEQTHPLVQQYSQYVAAALQNKVPPVPMDQFARLMESTRATMGQQQTMGFADGGRVPRIHESIPERPPVRRGPPPRGGPTEQITRPQLGTGGAENAARALSGRQAQLDALERRALGFADGGQVPRIHESIPERPPVRTGPVPRGGPTEQITRPQMGTGTLENAARAISGRQAQLDALERRAMGFADGGQVPLPARMVLDMEQGGSRDSIPAVIDGQQPAALDSGEMIFPTDVVQFFGTQKLQKMIEQARAAQGG